jgi:septal ring factor EnvC (AmiA/AmiB activator)
MAQPHSAPPISVPYGYGPPMDSAVPAPPQPRRSRAAVVVLSILVAVFVLAAGVLGTLLVVRNKQANDLDAKVTQMNTQLTAAKAKSEQLQKDLDTSKRDLDDAKGQLDEVTAQKQVVTDCINAVADFFDALDAAQGQNTAFVQAKEADMTKKCAAADKYI